MKPILLLISGVIACFSVLSLSAQEASSEATASIPEKKYTSVVFASQEDYIANNYSFENYFRIERDTPQGSRYVAVADKDSLMVSQKTSVWGIRYNDTLYLHRPKALKTFGYFQVLGEGRYRLMQIDMPPRAKIQEEIQISEKMRELYVSHRADARKMIPGGMFGGMGGGIGVTFVIPITAKEKEQMKVPLIPVVLDIQDESVRALTQHYVHAVLENYPVLKPRYESLSAEQFTQDEWLAFLHHLNAAAAGAAVQ